MSVNDASEWLRSVWTRAVREAGATAPCEEIEAVGQALCERWNDPHRRFHTLKHLADVLAHVEEFAPECNSPVLVRLAAFSLGAVFNAEPPHAFVKKSGEDAEASAELAYEELTELGVPGACATRVHNLIRAMGTHKPLPGDADSAVLCDADLGILATEPQRYKSYIAAIREEYSFLPSAEVLRARIAIIQHLLKRDRLFSSPSTEQWEEQARQNLSAELHRCEKELLKLDLASANTPVAA